MEYKGFCEYCDWGPNGFNECEIKKKYTLCKESSIEGLRAITQSKKITFYWNGREIKRDNFKELVKWIEFGKKAGYDIYKTPKESPFVKVLSSKRINHQKLKKDFEKNYK